MTGRSWACSFLGWALVLLNRADGFTSFPSLVVGRGGAQSLQSASLQGYSFVSTQKLQLRQRRGASTTWGFASADGSGGDDTAAHAPSALEAPSALDALEAYVRKRSERNVEVERAMEAEGRESYVQRATRYAKEEAQLRASNSREAKRNAVYE